MGSAKKSILEKIVRILQKDEKDVESSEFIKAHVEELESEINHEFSDFIYLILGVLSASFGLTGFLMPSAFIDGGVMGVSLMLNTLTGVSLSTFLVVLNLPFLILAYFSIGKRFAIKSVISIILLALVVGFFPFPQITDDKILIAAFGGLFLGLGIGLAIRGGGILDGTEVLAIYISRNSILTVGNVILFFNVAIFLVAAYLLSTEIALYAILTYFSASKTVDFVIDGIEEFMGLILFLIKVKKSVSQSLRKWGVAVQSLKLKKDSQKEVSQDRKLMLCLL